MKYKLENNKTSYPLISVSNIILVNFMNLATVSVSTFHSCNDDDRHGVGVERSIAVIAVPRGSIVLTCCVAHWTPGSVCSTADLVSLTTYSRADASSFLMPPVGCLH